ncbi:MAG: exosortase H [Thermoanaerobaculia bacterium]
MPITLRPELKFLLKFFGFILLFFALTAPKPLNDAIVEPFTAFVARLGGLGCSIFEPGTRTIDTVIASPRFSVNIRNGCNGLETSFLFGAAVLAFPARWRTRLLGLAVGLVAIQFINIVRIVALFVVGIHWPPVFDKIHSVVAPAFVILAGVMLFLIWADRFAAADVARRTPPAA